MAANPAPIDPHVTGFLAGRDEPCPRCGYNLRGAAGDACPECGQPLRLQLAGRDRWASLVRPAWAVLGLGLLINAGVSLQYGAAFAVPLLWAGAQSGFPWTAVLTLSVDAAANLALVVIGAVLAIRVLRRRRSDAAAAHETLVRGTLLLMAADLAVGVAMWLLRFVIW